MVCKTLRRMSLRRKLHILRTLTKTKSVKKSSIIMDALLYIYKLKLQIEDIKKQYHHLINHFQEVNLVNLEEGRLAIRITCKKGEELLVSILEAFEEMSVNVIQAKVTTNHFFVMEAIVEANVDKETLNEVIVEVIQRRSL